MKKTVVTVLALAVIGGAGYGYYRYSQKPAPPTVTTAAVSRGDIVETVGATGTLQAVTTVQVGSQVSGNIAFLGADFNSLVRKGQVLARLDPSLFEAQVQQTQANLAQARANLTRAQSDLERNRVQLTDAQQKYDRAKALSARSLLAQSDLDTAKTAVDTAQAALQSQQATVTQVQASITQAQASVNQAQVNLEHTVITAPIDGLVISRNVDVGQTVAASMQAPTLFVLAADLTKMQVVANLDESDVGRIRPKQVVTFRVDAYPNDTFRGTVSQVRLEPKVQQNVVTYATVIEVPNNDLRLKPGMTANVNVEISRATNVLRVPNTALRFRPSNEVFAALGQTPPEPQGRGFGPGGRRGGGAPGSAPGGPAPAGTSGSVETPPPAGAPAANVAANAAQGSSAPPEGTRGGRQADASQAGQAQTAPPDGGGRGGFGGGRRGAGGTTDTAGQTGDASADERRARFAERMQNMTPEEREAMAARMRERGLDPNNPPPFGRGGFGGAQGGPGGGRFGRGGQAADTAGVPTGGRRGAPQPAANDSAAGATTIDALFAPLPRTESFGRAWLYVANKLQPLRLRLGISDGQTTELIEGELKEGQEVVTNITIAGQTTRPATTAFPGFGGPGGRQGFPGGGFPGGGGGGRGR
ncbi:MAG: efflux RND transporter periplasmic adaptor subunit [Vicinamibacterales bacterium]